MRILWVLGRGVGCSPCSPKCSEAQDMINSSRGALEWGGLLAGACSGVEYLWLSPESRQEAEML